MCFLIRFVNDVVVRHSEYELVMTVCNQFEGGERCQTVAETEMLFIVVGDKVEAFQAWIFAVSLCSESTLTPVDIVINELAEMFSFVYDDGCWKFYSHK